MALRGIAMLRVDTFQYPSQQTRFNELTQCLSDVSCKQYILKSRLLLQFGINPRRNTLLIGPIAAL